MRSIAVMACLSLALFSCKKEQSKNDSLRGLSEEVSTYLKKHLSNEDYSKADLSRNFVCQYPNLPYQFVRVPLKNSKEFIVLRKELSGALSEGKFINIEKDPILPNQSIYHFNGEVAISSLDRKTVLLSRISNGYIEVFHSASSSLSTNQPRQSIEVHPADEDPEPDVITLGYQDEENKARAEDFISLASFFTGTQGGFIGFYGSINSPDVFYTDGGGGEGATTYYANSYPDPVVELEFDEVAYQAPVDIQKIFNCFDKIPSAGASYSIRLCSNLPVNSNPSASSNVSSGFTAGHVFLVITKTNGAASVTQSFGFYPKESPSWYNPLSTTASAIKFNSSTEINASIEMTMTDNQFNVIKENAIEKAKQPYNLADYNCSNYAIELFNLVRPDPLRVSGYSVPLTTKDPYNPAAGVYSVNIENSPQMLFLKLQQMKNSGSPESARIRIDQGRGYKAPESHGLCN